MASADFSAPVFRHRWRPWPFRADAEISGNKVQVFPPAGRGSTTSLRLGFGRCLVMQTYPRVGLVSAFCTCPPNFALGFLHPRPHGRKLALGYLVPPNRPIGDLHSRPNVMSYVQKSRDFSRFLLIGSGGWIRTSDQLINSQLRYHCATPELG